MSQVITAEATITPLTFGALSTLTPALPRMMFMLLAFVGFGLIIGVVTALVKAAKQKER